MATAFKFNLSKSPKKYQCPACNKKTFTHYTDASGNIAGEQLGRCDREHSCGYHERPSKEKVIVAPQRPKYIRPSLIHKDDLAGTLKKYKQNNLFKFLENKLTPQDALCLFANYLVGIDQTLPSTTDWTIFWQVDIHKRVRSGKLIKYKKNGRRDHSQQATWYHAINHSRFKNFNLVQCFFGEHLLADRPNDKVGIVESEKTAMIASHFMPEIVWLACGGKHGLSNEKCKVLRNRSVTLYPDLGAYHEWKIKASEFGYSVSNTLEKVATTEQRELGLDLADFLLPDEN